MKEKLDKIRARYVDEWEYLNLFVEGAHTQRKQEVQTIFDLCDLIEELSKKIE